MSKFLILKLLLSLEELSLNKLVESWFMHTTHSYINFVYHQEQHCGTTGYCTYYGDVKSRKRFFFTTVSYYCVHVAYSCYHKTTQSNKINTSQINYCLVASILTDQEHNNYYYKCWEACICHDGLVWLSFFCLVECDQISIPIDQFTDHEVIREPKI